MPLQAKVRRRARRSLHPQQTKMAEISITGKTVNGAASSVKVNGESVVSGRSVASPAEIFVPAETEAVLNLGNTGRIEISAGTNISLTFNETSISGDLTQGRIKVFSAAGTNVVIKTEDAQVVNDKTQNDTFMVEIVGFTTALVTDAGQAKINGVNVAAGESTSALPNKRASQPTRPRVAGKNNSTLYLLFGSAAAAIAVTIALAVSSNNNSNNVSPTR